MNHARKITASIPALGALGAAALLSACGDLVDMGGGRDVNPRRLYVNDAARNDSLPPGIVSEGVLFVLQPGKPYELRLKTSSPGDVLDFRERAASGAFPEYQKLSGTVRDGYVAYSLEPTKETAEYYYAFLLRADGSGAPGTPPDSAVRLVPVDAAPAESLAVRLLMVRELTSPTTAGFMDAAEKADYARAFHTELRNIYAEYGIAVDTSTLIVEPTVAPLAVSLDTADIAIPGTRRENAVNIYLVDALSSETTEGLILGFAPRESIDLHTDTESRVLINVRGGSATEMAVTAAHEMGHFFGLRHTSATERDRGYDRDESNRDDGFPLTPFCSILRKEAAGGAGSRVVTARARDGRAFCLRVAGVSNTCDCPDAGNLMYPYGCNSANQKALSADQRTFLRVNMGLYR